jgi:mannose-P-dolichol utilization defect protein 1
MSDKMFEQVAQMQPFLEPVLAQLRPYTKNVIPSRLIRLGRDYYSKRVFDTIVLDLDIFNPVNAVLLQLFISKSLSLGILGFSSIVKLPQIANIINQSSARGLSFSSILLETLSYFITIAYNFRQNIDFMNFGEVTFVALQNIIILLLILYYTNKASYINGFIGLLCLLAYSLFAAPTETNIGVLGNSDIKFLAQFAVPLTILAKLPQIIGNFKKKSTGALSLASVGAGLLGTLVRAFTLVSSGITDKLILLGLVASLSLNLILFLQILIFKPKKVSTNKKNK